MKLKLLPFIILPAVLAACGHGNEDYKKPESLKLISTGQEVGQNPNQATVKLKVDGVKVDKPTKALFTKDITVKLKAPVKVEDGVNVKVHLIKDFDKTPANENFKELTSEKIAKDADSITIATAFDRPELIEFINANADKLSLSVSIDTREIQAELKEVTFTTEIELKK